MKRGYILFALIIFTALQVLFALPTRAESFDIALKTNFDVQADKSVDVQTIFDITNTSDEATPEVVSLDALGSDVRDVSARYADGDEISVAVNQDQRLISLTLNQDNSGVDKKWSFQVSYTTDLVEQFGQTEIFTFPYQDLSALHVTSHDVVVSMDLELGVPALRGREADNQRVTTGKQILTWKNPTGPMSESVSLLFGDQALTNYTMEYNLKNEGWWWQTKSITLPPDTNQQKVFLNSLEPQPNSMRLDTDGNIIADYSLSPKQSLDVRAEAQIIVNNYNYNLENSKTIGDIPASFNETYLDAEGWSTTDVDAAVSSDVVAAEAIADIFEAVVASNQQDTSEYAGRKALADTLVGTLRQQGIPAREVLGKTFGNGNVFFDEAQNHAWAEAYVPGVGWITLDPLFETNTMQFGVTDVQRVGLVLRGVEYDFPPEQLDAVTVTFSEQDAPEITTPVPGLHASKQMILPGLALTTITVNMPPGVIVDRAGYAFVDQPVNSLGSLAPLQEVKSRDLDVAGSAFSTQTVQYGLIGDDGQLGEVLTETQTTISYLPMIILIGVAVVVVVAIIVIRKIRAKRRGTDAGGKGVVLATEEGGEDIEQDDLLPENEENEIEETQEAAEVVQEESKEEPPRDPVALEEPTPIDENEVKSQTEPTRRRQYRREPSVSEMKESVRDKVRTNRQQQMKRKRDLIQ